MVDLLQVSAMLALPMIVAGGLIWLLIYSAVRAAIRHEVTRLEQRKAAAGRAIIQGRPDAAGPRLVRPQPAARTTGHPRQQPSPRPSGDRERPVGAGARRRSAS